MKNFKILKFKDDDFKIDLNISKDERTAWFTQNDLSKLFNKNQSTISRHIKNILENEETKGNSVYPKMASVYAKSAYTASDGKSYEVILYSLKMVNKINEKLKSKRINLLNDFLAQYFSESSHESKGNIIIYNNGSIKVPLEISSKEQTIWANQEQISKLFETTQPNVSLHIKNILEDKELQVHSVHKDFLYTASDGKQYVVDFYNLDMILAIGYRVRTSKAIAFRNWASQILKEYIIEGHSVNDARCIECKNSIINLNERVALLEQKSKNEIDYFSGDELRGFVEIKRYLETAKKEIIIIDNYFGHEFDDVLKEIDVEKTIITNIKNTKINSCSFYKVIKNNEAHDRYIIVDNTCYHFGTSIKDLGDKLSSGHKISNPKVIDLIKSFKFNKEV